MIVAGYEARRAICFCGIVRVLGRKLRQKIGTVEGGADAASVEWVRLVVIR
jgi:hypothetical protein